jgi:DNA-binding SARP family transcriptional activator
VPGCALLIALALEPVRVVQKATLVDWIWGEHPPADAANALQRLASRLRKALPEGLVGGQTDGYRLTVEPDAVDAVRFERLVGRARGGEDPRRAKLLRDALGLWRGAAMQDVGLQDSAAFDAAVSRLEGLRLAAMEDRFESEIRLGGGAELVTELTDLVAAHPVRERLVAALMRALVAAGRKTEALLVYERAREALAERRGSRAPGPSRGITPEISPPPDAQAWATSRSTAAPTSLGSRHGTATEPRTYTGRASGRALASTRWYACTRSPPRSCHVSPQGWQQDGCTSRGLAGWQSTSSATASTAPSGIPRLASSPNHRTIRSSRSPALSTVRLAWMATSPRYEVDRPRFSTVLIPAAIARAQGCLIVIAQSTTATTRASCRLADEHEPTILGGLTHVASRRLGSPRRRAGRTLFAHRSRP